MSDSVKIKITGDDSDFRSKMQGLGGIAKKGALAVGAAFVTAGAAGMKYNAEMETYTTNFKVMLGSEEAALKKVAELKEFAAKTPFGMAELADATQTLLSFQIPAEDTTKIMSMLGDVSLGNKEKFAGLTLAFGQMSAAGKLQGEDLNQMIERGFNPLNYIAKRTGESMTELRDRMSKGGITTEEVTQAFEDATSKGGQFYKGMEEGSKTTAGLISTLKDTVQAKLGEAFQSASDMLKNLLPKVIAFFESFDVKKAAAAVISLMNTIKTLLPVIVSVVAATAAWKAGLMISGAISAVTKAVQISTGVMAMYSNGAKIATVMTTGFTTAQKVMGTIMAVATGKIKATAVAQQLLNAAMKANPIGLIITGITALIAIIALLWTKCDWFRNGVIAAFDMIKTAFFAAWEFMRGVWNTIVPYVLAFWEAVKTLFSAAMTAIAGFFSSAWMTIKAVWDAVFPYFQAIWEAIVLVFSVVATVLGGFFSAAWEAIKFIWDLVVAYFQNVWNGIVLIFSVAAAVLGGFFSAAWKAIKFIWDTVTGYFGNIWNGIKQVFSSVVTKFSEWFGGSKDKVTEIWDKIIGYFDGIWEGIKGVFIGEDGVVAKFGKWFSDAYEKVKEFFTVDNFKEVFNTSVVGGLGKIVDAVKTKAGDIWEEIKKALSKPIKVVLDFLGVGGGDGGGDYATEGATGKLTPYGSRVSSPYLKKRRGGVHTGIDFAAPSGTPIQSTTNGRIITSKNLGKKSYGQYVVVQDAQGFRHYYAHMSRRRAVVGQPVGRGSTIGYVGSTGNSTGPHLHYEVRRPGGGHTNPRPWYSSARGYATGGFPSLGEMFIANENGIEMMGKMGSKNVIANNMQIVEGIKAGIYSGMVNVARAKGSVNNKSVEVTQNMHFHKENTSPSDTKRAARRGIKLVLAGGIK